MAGWGPIDLLRAVRFATVPPLRDAAHTRRAHGKNRAASVGMTEKANSRSLALLGMTGSEKAPPKVRGGYMNQRQKQECRPKGTALHLDKANGEVNSPLQGRRPKGRRYVRQKQDAGLKARRSI